MSFNPHRELQALARDVRLIGWSRIPINIERACLIIINKNAYHTNASYNSAIRIAKLMKWANCEVYFITDPSVPEFVDALRHFATQTLNFLYIYYAGNPISQDTMDDPPILKVSEGTVGPDLFYSVINEKPTDLRIVICFDGVNNPTPWDPADQDLDEPGVLFIAPYPDPKQAHLQQNDLKNECLFIQELYTNIKSKPTITGETLRANIEKEILEFGQRVFCSSTPQEYQTDIALII
ncbi:hypothetical protein TRFO_15203 [Tritrichomonas foetus]|uniref:Uncharacterized protein n=1 Tax=Tritrichomonas foetus TaxID=1144522 RepID=A0A1J4KT05_9EUKA|nr:hypothetical protein TRFO_15203 [Tritrichomonas foetus]|eukprot:OHT14423.1 hypothetical protein TRFO_15203 [Tritrichomonas foetus]